VPAWPQKRRGARPGPSAFSQWKRFLAFLLQLVHRRLELLASFVAELIGLGLEPVEVGVPLVQLLLELFHGLFSGHHVLTSLLICPGYPLHAGGVSRPARDAMRHAEWSPS